MINLIKGTMAVAGAFFGIFVSALILGLPILAAIKVLTLIFW